MTFLQSDYLERDQYRKFTAGLAHTFGGILLVIVGMPLLLPAIEQTIKK